MTSHINVSGTWKEVTEKHVNVSGTWKEITNGYVNVSGTWKEFFSSSFLDPDLDGTTETYSHTGTGGAGGDCRIQVDTDGDIYQKGGLDTKQDDWLLSGGTASEYEVKADVVSGTVDVGDSTGTFLALTTDRQWGVQESALTTDTLELTITIRHATNTSDSISFTAELSATGSV